MVFAVEPRVFVPDTGVVSFEDTYVLMESELKPITKSRRELVEISRNHAD